MSLLVVCPDCSAKLSAPESAAGKKVRCPKCQTAVPVPAPVAEVETVEPEPERPEPQRPTRTASGPAREADEDDDRPRRRRRADDEDGRPRTKRERGRKVGGVPPALLFGGIAAVVVAVVAVGFAVYWLGFRDRTGDGAAAQNGPGEPPPAAPGPSGAGHVRVAPPAGWKEFAAERDGFKAFFAGDPATGATVRSSRSVGGGGQAHYRDYSYRSHPSWADLALTVRVYEFPATSTPQQQQAFADQVCSPADAGEAVTERRAAALGGVDGKEAVGEAKVGPPGRKTADGRSMPTKLVSVNRWIVADNKCYHLKVQGHDTRPKDADAFFDNFALARPPAPTPTGGGGPPEPKEPKEPPKPVVVPAGWAAYQPAGAGFRAAVPAEVTVTDATTKLPSKWGQPMLRSVTLHRATDADGVVYEVRVVQFSPAVENTADQSNAIRDVVNAPVFEKRVRLGSGASQAVTWGGKPARESTYGSEQGVARETHTAAGGFTAAVYARQGKPDPEKVRAFLDSIQFTD